MTSHSPDNLDLSNPKYECVRKAAAQNPHYAERQTFLYQINVTRDCNLRCTHCYIASEVKAISGRLTTSQFLKIVSDIAEHMVTSPHNHAEIHVIGGEPTMLGASFYDHVMPKAYEIMSISGSSFTWEFILVTNLLSREMMDIAPWFSKIGTAYEPITRFPKQFHEDWWKSNVHKLQDGGVEIGITSCITRQVIDYGARDLCDHIFNDLRINKMHFGFYIESGDGRKNAQTVTPRFDATSRFLIEAAEWYFERRDTHPDLYVNPVESILTAIHRDEPLDDIICPIISGSLDIDSSGKALSCIQAGGELDAPWEGDVLQTSVRDVVNGDAFKRRRIEASRPQKICQTCDEYRVCRSGCGVNFKGWDPADGDDCPGYKQFIKFMRQAHASGIRPRHDHYHSGVAL